MYYSKQLDFEKKHIETFTAKTKDSLLVLRNKLEDADYFSVENNQNAQDYFDNDAKGTFVDVQKMSLLVKDKLLDYNSTPDGNPYTGFVKLNDKKFIINKVKVLNHRWIIADFNNGELWGEAIIKYFLNEDESVSFETSESLVYPK